MRKPDGLNVLLVLGGLLLADRVLGLFSDPNDPGTNPYPPPGGPPAQWNAAQVRGYADQLESWFWSPLGENEPAIILRLAMVPTDADMVNLINAYGQRGSALGFDSLTLPASVGRWLEPSQIDAINSALRTRGVRYQF